MAGRILIVDDHEVVRNGLRSLLSARPEWEICGEAEDGIDAIEKAKVLRPSVVVMDVSMPRMDGLEATRIIRRELPDSQVVIVSQNDPAVVHHQAKEVKAAAFVSKNALAQKLIPTLDKVFAEFGSGEAREPAATGPQWLAGSAFLGRLIREHDWSKTSLGPIEEWAQSLKTSVNLILNSQHPMWIGWGPEMTFLYNDAYIQVLSLSKHPWALGKPAKEVWAEIWDICGPLADKVFQKGEAAFVDEVRLLMKRADFIEETYYSFSYSPIRDESGAVAGLFCPSTEVTPKVINARRLRTLSELSANALLQKTEEAACDSVSATLAKNAEDIPFFVFYLIDPERKQARLQQVCGLPEGISDLTPDSIDLDEERVTHPLWPLAEVVSEGRSQVVSVKHVEGLPLGVGQQPVSEATVLPLSSRGEDGTMGVLIAGVNPARKLDVEYRTFYDLVAGQIANAIQNARAAEQERKRLEALAEIDRAKTAFFSNVSHEFRTPLTLMLGPVEDLLAKSHVGLSPAAKSQLELVNRNGSRLLRLVNTLLDFSRIEVGRMLAIYEATDLAAFTIDLASVFRSATERAGLKLELNCPELGEPVYVDRGMWEKIVLNLISNAFKFTFEGAITVSLTRVGDQVELRVRDTGVGIPEQELPRLFDRFHRVENTRSRTHEGSGIGLALVQELVKLHGGSVRAESEVGKGTTFIVSVPLGTSHLRAERIGGPRTLASTALGAAPYVEEALRWLPDSEYSETSEVPKDELIPVPCPPLAQNDAAENRPRILVADDNADMRQYLARLLSERYAVLTFPDGREALKAVRAHSPDLVLTDVMMPNLDGFGLLHELRSDPVTRTIPVILLSARAGEESRVEGMEHGADDYLIKPFSARELLARVQTHLEMARIRKQAEEALRRRTEQFETLLNEAPLGVYLVDQDLRIRAINPPALRTFGHVRNPVGRDFDEVIHLLWPENYADEIVERFRHTLATGEPYIVPERIEERLDRGVREIYEWQINRITLPEGGYGVVCYFRDISRQVLAREEIKESEKKLRLATEAAELGIWQWYPDEDRAIWDNDRCYEIFGRARHEAPLSAAKFTGKVIHPEDKEAFQHALANTLGTGERFLFQGRIRGKGGSWAWVEFRGQMEHPSDGSPRRLLGTVLDISERRRAERANGLLAAIVDCSDDAIISKRLDGTITSWNKAAQRMFGYTAEEAIGQHITLIIPPDRRAEETAIIERLKRGERIDHFETVRMRKNGTLLEISLTISPVKDQAGCIVGASKVARDITYRKQVEEREREMKGEAIAATAKFRAVFEQTPVFAGIVALDGTVMDANQLCLEACGYRAEDVLGRPFWETGWWRGSKQTQDKIREATIQAAKGAAYRETLTYHWADDSERVVDFAIHPIRDEKGEILFLHPTGVDITDLKRAEENYRTLAETLDVEVRARTSELEERNNEVLRQSEQLRTLSRRLLRAQDEERRRIARELHDSAGQILTQLGMILARVAQEARQGGSYLAKDAEDSERLVQQLSQEIRTMSYLLHPPLLDEIGLSGALRWYTDGLMERSGMDIRLSVADDFGRLPSDMELVMFRLVQECLTNIHRHSESRSAVIQLSQDEKGVLLSVRDQGKGMSAEQLSEVRSGGAGVGIRGMRERIRQFDGQMDIESSAQGTEISFTIPLAKSEEKRVAVVEPIRAIG